MNRVIQSAFLDAVNSFLPEGLTWSSQGEVPEVMTKEFFNSIKWLPKGKDIHGDEVSLNSPVSFTKFVEKYESLKQQYMYVSNRKSAYPTIADQLDMLWHAIDTNTLNKDSKFYLKLKAVKEAIPKPE